MKDTNCLRDWLTNEKAAYDFVRSVLELADPGYPREETQYLAACAILIKETDNAVSPGAEAYINAKKQEFSSDALYAAWQGFLLNLRIHQNPVNALLLGEDFEDLHQERRMHTLPTAKQARKIISSFHQNIPEGKRYLTDPVDDYFAYLQTVGYKLAHYIGFLFGNRFLAKVIPGYTVDEVCTDRYTRILCEFLQMDVDKIHTLM